MEDLQQAQRTQMWCSLIPFYQDLSTTQKKKAKRAYAADRGCTPGQITGEDKSMSDYDPITGIGWTDGLGQYPPPTYAQHTHTYTVNVPVQQEDGQFGYTTMTTDSLASLKRTDGYSSDLKADLLCQMESFKANNKKKETNMRDYDYDCDACASNLTVEQNYLIERLYEVSQETYAEAQKAFHLVDDAAPKTAEEMIARITAGKYVLDEKDAKKASWNTTAYIEWRDPSAVKDEAGFKAQQEKQNAAFVAAKDVIYLGDKADALKAVLAVKETLH